MKDKYYFTDDIAVINFDLGMPDSRSGLLKTDGFADIALQFLAYVKESNPDLYDWAVKGKNDRQAVKDIVDVARAAIVFELEELDNPYLEDTDMFLEFVEEFFDFWKDHQRYSVITINPDADNNSFVNQDSAFNHLVRNTFRTLEQTLVGRKTQVFRQQPSGTNGAIACYKREEKTLSDRYSFLNDVMFIDSLMMRTPMILHPKSNKREGMFEEVEKNPAYSFDGNPDDYFCYPAKVGSLLIFICFHKDYISSGVPCANLFEIATPEEAAGKPDGIVIFGNPDGQGKCTFYHDCDEEVWVGSVSSSDKIEYFGYMKKMVLTIHNAIMMQKEWLPIHGAFINITMKNGVKKGICLMGDSGAGKSETIEALKALGKDKIRKMDIVFDDMGTFHIEDGVVYAQGTETGAFVRLDDLDPGAPYRDMNRSIFFNPDKHNARVITPAAPYKIVANNHKVDLFAYANNYDDKTGLNRFETAADAKEVFVRGRRMAKGTTQEVGLSETYFANPFGPMQKQDICEPIIDKVFATLEKNGTFIGEVYTHLGLNPEGDDIGIAAEALLDFIES